MKGKFQGWIMKRDIRYVKNVQNIITKQSKNVHIINFKM